MDWKVEGQWFGSFLCGWDQIEITSEIPAFEFIENICLIFVRTTHNHDFTLLSQKLHNGYLLLLSKVEAIKENHVGKYLVKVE